MASCSSEVRSLYLLAFDANSTKILPTKEANGVFTIFPQVGFLSCVADSSGLVVYCTGGRDPTLGFDNGYSKLTFKKDDDSWIEEFISTASNPLEFLIMRTKHSFKKKGGEQNLPPAIIRNKSTIEVMKFDTDVQRIQNIYGSCGAIIQNDYYIIGGTSQSLSVSGSLSVIKIQSKGESFTYTNLTTASGPKSSSGVSCVSDGNTITVVGGCQTGGSPLESPWKLSIDNGNIKWEQLQGPRAGCFGGLGKFPGSSIYMIVGNQSTTSSVILYDTSLQATVQSVPSNITGTSLTLPTGLNATNQENLVVPVSIASAVVVLIGLIICGVCIFVIRRRKKFMKLNNTEAEDGFNIDPSLVTSSTTPGRIERKSSRREIPSDGYFQVDSELTIPRNPSSISTTQMSEYATLVAKIPSADFVKTDGTKYEILFDHIAVLKDELNLKAGDHVVITKVFEDGWAKGFCGENVGFLPLTHLGHEVVN
ncbi:hypothetical protein HK096_006715 [Nowakowskiella sp. JEL0078]|nr:hypothetical protein HK096_006715 [Nowakowskiella sp. JEL0078]